MNWQQRAVIGVLFLLLVGNLTTLVAIDTRVDELDAEMESIREQNQDYQDELAAREDNATSPSALHASRHTVRVPVALYVQRDRAGAITPMHVTTLPGNGTYIRIDNATYSRDLQQSVKSPRSYISTHPSYELPHEAVYLGIQQDPDWGYIGGQSLQLPLTIALLATHTDVQLNNSVAMTGAITDSGEVTQVSSIRSKAIAAKENGYTVFLVPPGQSVSVDGIAVREVETVQEAAELTLEQQD